MIATLLIYSGIENPRWTLAPAQAAEVAGAIGTLPTLDRPCPPPRGLGYAGVGVTAPDLRGGERAWTFSNGVAMSNQRCFPDAGRRIERLVLETARGHVDAAVLAGLLE